MSNPAHHAGQKPVTVWLPAELATQLDQKLADQVAGLPGARPSRQGYVVEAIKQALSATAQPAQPVAAPTPCAAPVAQPEAAPAVPGDSLRGSILDLWRFQEFFEITGPCDDGIHPGYARKPTDAELKQAESDASNWIANLEALACAVRVGADTAQSRPAGGFDDCDCGQPKGCLCRAAVPVEAAARQVYSDLIDLSERWPVVLNAFRQAQAAKSKRAKKTAKKTV